MTDKTSETPRTDAVSASFEMTHKLCKQLERELAAVEARVKQYMDIAESVSAGWHKDKELIKRIEGAFFGRFPHDKILDCVIQLLHYQDNCGKIDVLKTAEEVTNFVLGGVPRYMNDSMFRARCDQMTSQLYKVVNDLYSQVVSHDN